MRNLLTGRLTRTNFLLCNIGLALVTAAVRYLIGPHFGRPDASGLPTFHPGLPSAMLLWEVASLVLWALPIAMRLRDVDLSGRWAWLVPAVGIAGGYLGLFGGGVWLLLLIAFVLLLFWPPTRGPNRFARDPRGWESPEHFERQRRELAGRQSPSE